MGLRLVFGQVSNEFITYLSILTLLLIIAISLNYGIYPQLIYQKVYREAEEMAEDVAFEINLALRAGDGYSREFYLKNTLYGIRNFSVEVKDYLVTVRWKDGYASSPIGIETIEGSIKKGRNLIKNVGGKIYVE